MQWKDTMWSCWKQKHNSSPSTLQCENAFRIWSHIVLFSYTLILKHMTLLPSKWVCMVTLLILNFGFLLICRRRLENCAEWRANFTTGFSGWKGNLSEPAAPQHPFLLSSMADPFCGTAVGCISPVAIFRYSPRQMCLHFVWFSASSTRKGGRIFPPPLSLNFKQIILQKNLEKSCFLLILFSNLNSVPSLS